MSDLVEQITAALRQIVERHQPRWVTRSGCDMQCASCVQEWPCPDLLDLGDALGVEP